VTGTLDSEVGDAVVFAVAVGDEVVVFALGMLLEKRLGTIDGLLVALVGALDGNVDGFALTLGAVVGNVDGFALTLGAVVGVNVASEAVGDTLMLGARDGFVVGNVLGTSDVPVGNVLGTSDVPAFGTVLTSGGTVDGDSVVGPAFVAFVGLTLTLGTKDGEEDGEMVVILDGAALGMTIASGISTSVTPWMMPLLARLLMN